MANDRIDLEERYNPISQLTATAPTTSAAAYDGSARCCSQHLLTPVFSSAFIIPLKLSMLRVTTVRAVHTRLLNVIVKGKVF